MRTINCFRIVLEVKNYLNSVKWRSIKSIIKVLTSYYPSITIGFIYLL